MHDFAGQGDPAPEPAPVEVLIPHRPTIGAVIRRREPERTAAAEDQFATYMRDEYLRQAHNDNRDQWRAYDSNGAALAQLQGHAVLGVMTP